MSAIRLNNFINPNGKQGSIKIKLSHYIARRWRSAGCTGIKWKVLLISILASRDRGPIERILLIASSIVTYDIEQRSLGIPSSTLFLWIGQVNKKPPLAGLMWFWDHTKSVNVYVMNKLFSKRTCYSAFNYLSAQVFSYSGWSWEKFMFLLAEQSLTECESPVIYPE